MAIRRINWDMLLWIILFWAVYLAAAPPLQAKSIKTSLKRTITQLVGAKDSVMVFAPNGNTIVSINADQPLVPASILKVLTGLAAIKQLGSDFRFKTEFYIDAENNLKIKGYGDPLLLSERLDAIGAHLAGILPMANHIVLDDTYFRQPIRIPGRGRSMEPYDAPNGALCVNFNTVAFSKKNGQWISDEPQTPLLPLVIPKIESSGLTSGRITLVANRAEALEYTGSLFKYFLVKNGITVKGSIRSGRFAPQLDRLLWQHQSENDLSQTIAQLLAYSNNFMANQILLVLGAEAQGPPATMGKGLEALKHFYRTALGINTGRIIEASGISRQNRITARAMSEILKAFTPYHQLMRHEGRQYYKTGHLKGIRTRAGYITSRDGGHYGFVVMLNTLGKSPHQIMKVLERELP